MTRWNIRALAALLLALAGAMASGCGSSQTKTVTVASSPPASQPATTQTTGTATSTSTTPATTTSAPAGAPGPATTRSAPEPAFTEGETHAEGVSQAASIVRARGYTPNNTAEYHQGQTLRVLVGTRTGSGDGYGQQAFFFVGGRFIGTDAKEPSASVRVATQGDTEVVLLYPLYRHGDALCCPGGGQATVHFQLNNGRLAPIGTIPSASASAALSRY